MPNQRPPLVKRAQEQLVSDATTIFNGELVELIDTIRRDKEQAIDHESFDTVIRSEWEGDAQGERRGGWCRISRNI